MTERWIGNKTRDSVLNSVAKHRAFIVFDTETTGLSPKNGDRIIELSARKYRLTDDGWFELIDVYDQFLKPPFKLERNIEALTGITNELLENKPSFKDVALSVRNFFGTHALLIGHNVKFDINFMESEFEHCGMTFQYSEAIDTLQIARERISKSEVENHKLFTILNYLGLNDGLTAHQARNDTEATFRIFEKFYLDYLDEASTKPTVLTGLVKPTVTSVEFWKGFRGMSRIYVNVSSGDSIFYDIRNYGWGSKDLNLDDIDMDYLIMQCLAITKCADMCDFSKFKGRAIASA